MKSKLNIEFFTTTDGKEIIVNDGDNFFPLKSDDRFLDILKKRIYSSYPKAANQLDKIYGDDYSKILRFCKCNFSERDHIPDMTDNHFNIEYVSCPMRGECEDENIICNPQLRTGLTVRETQIAVLISQSKTIEDISSDLFISPDTVISHRKNIYRKLKIHTASELTRYIIKNKIDLS